MKLLVEAGEFASTYQDIAHHSLRTTRVEADEIWAFVCKAAAGGPAG